MSITETAHAFFDTCETGGGWAGCAQYCHDGAPFSCQSDALADVGTLEAYADWMRDLPTPIPDGHVYAMEFDGDRIRHMTKIWNDAQSLKALGWA